MVLRIEANAEVHARSLIELAHDRIYDQQAHAALGTTTREGATMKVNFGRLLRQHCQNYADSLALVNVERDRRYSFREFHLLTNRIANMMRTTLGLGKGDNVAFILENDNLSLVHHLMVLKQEATCAYTNFRNSSQEHLWQIDHIKAKTVFLEAALLDKYYEPLSSRGCTVVVMDPAEPREGVVSFWDAVNVASDAETRVELDDREHIAILRFTGGTTGRGKCVMYTPDNLMCIHETRLAYTREQGLQPGLRSFHMLPLSHAGIAAFACAFMAGGTNYTLNVPDLKAWCRVVEVGAHHPRLRGADPPLPPARAAGHGRGRSLFSGLHRLRCRADESIQAQRAAGALWPDLHAGLRCEREFHSPNYA